MREREREREREQRITGVMESDKSNFRIYTNRDLFVEKGEMYVCVSLSVVVVLI